MLTTLYILAAPHNLVAASTIKKSMGSIEEILFK